MSILETSILSLLLAQFIKIFTTSPPDFSRIAGSGGMPSSHAAFVSTLSTLIGLEHGFNSDLFAIVAVFSLIILYDARGVRRSVGLQANVINHLIQHLDITNLEQNKEIFKTDLKELIGHTPFEVLVGTLLGIAFAILSKIF